MAKRNPRVKSVANMRPQAAVRGVGSAWRVTPSAKISRAVQSRGEDDLISVQMAKDGDDTYLLPYQPTPSINPPRPRTLAAGYNTETETLRVRFRDGAIYEYYDVPQRVWRNFKRVKSPGRAVNRTLNQYEYAQMDM